MARVQLKEIDSFAGDTLDSLLKEKKETAATVLGLSGELGSGKTTFVQALARTLGIAEHVTSPTFVIEKAYDLHDQAFGRLIHIDAYRLEGAHELRSLGFEDMLSDSANLVVIEWPERVKEILPGDTHELHFAVAGDREREINVRFKAQNAHLKTAPQN